MSLCKHHVVPIDTHMWQIAIRDYGLNVKKGKTLTAKSYALAGDHFRSIFGEYAGWAHSVSINNTIKQNISFILSSCYTSYYVKFYFKFKEREKGKKIEKINLD